MVRTFRKLIGTRYEERFDGALAAAIRPGDTVWDVGANLGLYTEKFANQVGPAGHVAAFEPSPRNVVKLRARFPESRSVTVLPIALGDQPGTATFYSNQSADGTTDSLMPRVQGAVPINVPIHQGDEFLARHPPNVIKIDVEGFELEAVRGMRKTLASPNLRSVLIEVHFGILSDRGIQDAPAQLAALLKDCGLAVSWVDASHLIGMRAA